MLDTIPRNRCGEASKADIEATVNFDDENASVHVKWKALHVFACIFASLWLLSAGVGFFRAKKNVKGVKFNYRQVGPGGCRGIAKPPSPLTFASLR